MFKDIPLQKKYSKEFSKRKYVGVFQNDRCIKSYGLILKSLVYGHISNFSLEACRQMIKKKLTKQAKLLFRVYPSIPVYCKPKEVRMGRGKGDRLKGWFSFVKPGDILIELRGVSFFYGVRALEAGAKKLPIVTKISKSMFF